MIKGQGRFNLYVAKKIAANSRKYFLAYCKTTILEAEKNSATKTDVKIFSFSGNAYFQEQLFSIAQYVKKVGVPNQWLIVNDGTYNLKQIDFLQNFPFVKVVEFDWVQNTKFELLRKYANKHVWAKIFYAYFNFLDNLTETTIYLEADILVFDKFNYYCHLFKSKNWYLADTGPHFDSYYYQDNKLPMFDVNNGFAIYNSRPPIEIAYEYLTSRFEQGNFEYFTPQGAMQLMIAEDKSANFLDPRYFVVNCSDHFKIGKDFRAESLALRHFVGPVRHKMWQYSWKKVLGV